MTAHDVGRDLLGPLIYRFCYQLWLHQIAWQDRDAVALFLSRGGIRLRYFYEVFLKRNGLPPPLPIQDFYISRMAGLGANLISHPGVAAQDLAKEFNNWTVHDSMGALLPWHVFEPWWNALGDALQKAYRQELIDAGRIGHLLGEGQPGSGVLRAHFESQAQLARRHLDERRLGKHHILLVDTGWSGSILSYFQMAHPDLEFMGHFFGRYAYDVEWKPWFSHLVGVELEDVRFRWHRPHTSIFQHRHLIEGMCEMVWPSVEWYRMGEQGKVESQAGPIPEEVVAPQVDEAFAQGVVDYIKHGQPNLRAAEIHRAAASASLRLRQLICFPRANQVHAMSVRVRSADFGKNMNVSVLLEPTEGRSLSQIMSRINRSLWPEGQIAVEFGLMRLPVQLMYRFAPDALARSVKKISRLMEHQ